MDTAPFRLGGATYHLLLNGAALFELYDSFGTAGSLTDPLRGTGKQSFEALCRFLAVLAEQGELWRRYQGHDKAPIPSEELFRLRLRPAEVPEAKQAVLAALAAGFRREEGQEGREVDLGLLELEKKTGTG